MPNVNSSFQGAILVIPGAYYADNVSAVLQPTLPPTPPLIFIGFGYGQQPQTATTYLNANDLLAAIRGGPCSGFVPFMCSPSPSLQGAQQITYINPGENTQSALTLYQAAGSGVINMVSANFGLPSNLLQMQIQPGSTAGLFITLYDAFGNSTVQGNNLGVPFLVAYLGAASGVSYSVAYAGGAATQLSIVSPLSGQSLTIPFGPGQYSTVEQVVEYLNGTGVYSAQVLSSTNGQLPASMLDSATGIGLPAVSGGITTFIDVTASVGDIVYWVNQFGVNSQGQQLAIATAVSGFTPTPALLPNTIPFTAFSGAVSIPPTLTDYANAFNLALSLPGWIVFADSNASGVQALGTQHALTASEIANGMWRRFFTGSSPGDSVSTTVVNAEAQDSNRTTYVYPGIYATNGLTGINSLYGGLYAAAAAAGMATGNPPNIALTNKPLSATGVEFTLTVSEINTLQQAGVMPIYIPGSTPGVPTICSDLTCWQVDSNPANVFNQQIACRDFTAYTLVNALQPYVGTTASPNTEVNLLRAAQRALNALIYTGSGYGTLSSWDPNSLNLVYNGQTQTAEITVNVTLVGQNRFITIYVPIQPLNFTSTLSTTGTQAAA